MYQAISSSTTVDAINLEGGTDENPGPELVKIDPPKKFEGGAFKFTVGSRFIYSERQRS